MTKKTRFKLNYLFANLKKDITVELKKVRDGKEGDLDFYTTDNKIEELAGHIMYLLSPYGKDLDKYRFFSKWKD